MLLSEEYVEFLLSESIGDQLDVLERDWKEGGIKGKLKSGAKVLGAAAVTAAGAHTAKSQLQNRRISSEIKNRELENARKTGNARNVAKVEKTNYRVRGGKLWSPNRSATRDVPGSSGPEPSAMDKGDSKNLIQGYQQRQHDKKEESRKRDVDRRTQQLQNQNTPPTTKTKTKKYIYFMDAGE